jgi:hypothetical protein
MGGVPIIGDVVEAVEDIGKGVGQAIGVVPKKKTTAQTRPAETAKETKPAVKKDITRVLRRGSSKARRRGRGLIGGMLAGPAGEALASKNLNPIRNPRDQSTLG